VVLIPVTCILSSLLSRLPPCPLFFFHCSRDLRHLHSFPTRRSSDLDTFATVSPSKPLVTTVAPLLISTEEFRSVITKHFLSRSRSEEHTSELQSRFDLVCRLLLEKKKK